MLEAVDGLRRRSLLERGQQADSFTLQSMMLEYVTGKLVSTASEEIVQGQMLREHALSQARAKEYVRLQGHHGSVTSVAFSPDGSRLASGSGNRGNAELLVWDAHSGKCLHAFSGQPGVVYALTWCPSGQRLISGGSDGRLRWWQVQPGECVRVQEAHERAIQALKVSPDGSRLASDGDDGAIKLWDLEGGEPLRTLRRDRPYERLNITGIRGLTAAELATLRALGAVEEATSPL